jgi:hypothetical protein
MLRVAGAAGLAYVAGVSIENMNVLEAPGFGAPAADIRAHHADQAFGIVTAAAGTIALLAYVVFAVALYLALRDGGMPWALLGLIGGVAGPVIAASGQVTHVLLVADPTGFGDDRTRSLYEFQARAQMVAGLAVALTLAGFGVAALRTRRLPRPLALFACGLAVPMLFVPIAAFTDDNTLRDAVTVVYGAQTLWIFVLGLWLVLGGAGPVTLVRRAAFLTLVIAAGLVGLAMVAVPAATPNFFSWGLEPAALCSFSGGVYIASASVYALGIGAPWPVVRGLVAGAAVLSVSVFVVTLNHLDIFDFDRLQAWAWVVLFAGFAATMLGLLVVSVDEGGERDGTPLAPWVRATFAAVAVLLVVVAVALWADPVGVGEALPYDLPPLGGRFAGCWVALLGFLCGWAAVRNRHDEARYSALALAALPLGALLAGLRTIGDLEPAGAAAAYLGVLALLVAAGISVATNGRGAVTGGATGDGPRRRAAV